MKKSRAVASLILDILIIGCVAFGMLNMFVGILPDTQTVQDVAEFFRYFTVLSNLLAGLAALCSLIMDVAVLACKKPCKFVSLFRLIATVGVTVTILTVYIYLAPIAGQGWIITYNPRIELFYHTIVPVLAIAAFIVENKPRLKYRAALLGMLPVVLYAAFMLPMVNAGLAKDPYGFLKFDPANWYISAAWIGGMLLGSYVIAVLLITFHNLGKDPEEAALPAGEEAAEQSADANAPASEEANASAETPSEESAGEAAQEAPADENAAEAGEGEENAERPVLRKKTSRRYAVSVRNDGRWQVRPLDSKQPIAIFDTRQEALAFLQGHLESQGIKYRIHDVPPQK